MTYLSMSLLFKKWSKFLKGVDPFALDMDDFPVQLKQSKGCEIRRVLQMQRLHSILI